MWPYLYVVREIRSFHSVDSAIYNCYGLMGAARKRCPTHTISCFLTVICQCFSMYEIYL